MALWRVRLFWFAIAAGFAALAYGLTLPVYTDKSRASELKLNACDSRGVVEGWYSELSALETLRHPLMQGGLSLILAALTCWLLWKSFEDEDSEHLLSPERKSTFFALGTAVFALSWLAQTMSLVIDLRRGEFPHCADTIGIPIGFLTTFYSATFVVCVLIGSLVATRFKSLPSRLLAWDRAHPSRSWLVTIPCAFFAAIIVFFGMNGAYLSAFIGTPAAIVALYLIEATRSSLLTPQMATQDT